ncbi:Zinc-type alcohol dehydrogenase-like protein [Ruegeria sp. THAF57]|uniref:zinc-binding alcohol dehydrogenase family protein n=1 Tax=Ruegeria sp. THAF57 TaxID=2744555 RepID=UPI0015DDDEC7|nr:zinc-binding alcohol dehydrogenase family protein [Ruegeria sp. THAF57]CAD0187216.1 Zinc-type alcohol dehydrogenase-like protein [Ruegeria sp. THAF57]
MRAVGYTKTGPVTAADALIDFEADAPTPGPRDLLVAVKGVSVNPVDVKLRAGMEPGDAPKVLGFDAAGVVQAVGADVTGYKVGDEVFYAGDFTRPGTNSELHVVDERIVGRKPASLGFAEAAGHPLTAITAWEILFDSFALTEGSGAGETLLIIGGAGGVGSILIQLAKVLTGLTVIATASRPETVEWVKKMGADHVINHRESLPEQVAALGLHPKYIAGLTGSDEHFPALVEVAKPRGHIALIDDPEELNILPAKLKALSISWEFMFTRSMFQTEDMDAQRDLLNRVADLLDAGKLQSTVTANLGKVSAQSLIEAHRIQESGRVIGKNVLDV